MQKTSFKVKMNGWRSWGAVIISALVTVGVFSYLFSHITWGQVARLLVSVNLPLAGVFVLLSLLQHLVRTIRYRLVLQATRQTVGFFRLFLTVLVRGFCVDLLPARTGELVYVFLLKARLGVELGAATTSFALPFLFDVMVLGPLLLLAALTVVSTSLPVSGVLAAGGFLFICAAALVALFPVALRVCFGMMPAGRRWRRLRHFVASIHWQLHRVLRAGIYGKLFALSVLVRLFKYGSMYALLYALLKPEGITLAQLSFPRAFLGFCSAEMAASLPVSGIAGFGAYEGVWSLVFRLLGFPDTMASVTAVSHHLFTQLYGYSLGLAALAVLMVRKRRE